jgi:hypothetical protein
MIGAWPLLAIYLTRHATYSAILVEEKKVWKTLLPQPQPQLDLSLKHRSGACSSPCDLPRHSPLLRERKELFPVARPYKGQTSIVSLPASKPPTTPTIQYAATRSEPALDYLRTCPALVLRTLRAFGLALEDDSVMTLGLGNVTHLIGPQSSPCPFECSVPH